MNATPPEQQKLRDLLILGDGIHSLEMAEMVDRINAVEPAWAFTGFVSPDIERVGRPRGGWTTIGILEALERHTCALLVPDNEWPRSMLPSNRTFTSLIDPTALLSRTATVGHGCVIYPHCFVGANARIGDYVFCLSGSVINHDTVIDERAVIASGVTLAGGVYVEPDCYLGQSCSVRQNVRIGRGSTIGMGAVVINDVPSGSTIVGNPGREMSRNEPALIGNTK